MQLKSPRVWQPILLVSAGIIAGGGAMFFITHHDDHSGAATTGGAMKVASTATAVSPPAASIEIDGTRIPTAPQVFTPAAPSGETEHMQFNPGPSGQKSLDYDARTVQIEGRQLEFGRTTSGYPINVGRKAVDSDDPEHTLNAASGVAVTQDPGGWRSDSMAIGPYIGPKGLVENPSVDPPSTHGASYSRGY